jgi:hypothetical protein
MCKPEGSFPHSQAPTICPFLEPDESIPRHLVQFIYGIFNIILPSAGVFWTLPFPQVFDIVTSYIVWFPKGGYTVVTLPRFVTRYRDSVDGTRDRVTYQKLVTR